MPEIRETTGAEDGVRVIRITDTSVPNGKQAEFYRACEEEDSEEILYDGSIRAGKTQACCRKIVEWAWRYGGRYVVARKTYPELIDSTMAVMMRGEGAMPPALPPQLIQQYKASERTVTLLNGAEILFRNLESAEEGRAKLRNLSLNGMFIDQVEELDGEDWAELYEELLGRLSDPRGPGKMVLAANPGPTDHWVYRRFIDPETSGRYPQARYIHCTLYDNRENLDERYFQSRIRTETQNPEYFKRMVLGEWGAFGTKRFKVWNREKHVVDPFPVPKFWEIIESIDFGYSHPFVCLWVAIDERERYFVIGEHWEKERPASYHAGKILQVRERNGWTPTATWADPSIFAGRNGMSSPAYELMDYGVYPSPADNDRLGGWNRIEEMLLNEVDGQPQLRVFSTCRHLIKELPNLRFKDNSDDVEKYNDHSSDALRYAVMSRPPAARPPDEEDDLYSDRRSLYAARKHTDALRREQRDIDLGVY